MWRDAFGAGSCGRRRVFALIGDGQCGKGRTEALDSPNALLIPDSTHSHYMPADADLTARKIERQGSGVQTTVGILALVSAFNGLLTLGLFPRAHNHMYQFYFMYNEEAVETISMSTRLLATPLLFMTKVSRHLSSLGQCSGAWSAIMRLF